MSTFLTLQVKCNGCPKTVIASSQLAMSLGILGGWPLSSPVPVAGPEAIVGWRWPKSPDGEAMCPSCLALRAGGANFKEYAEAWEAAGSPNPPPNDGQGGWAWMKAPDGTWGFFRAAPGQGKEASNG